MLDKLGVNEMEKILTTAANGIWEQYVETMAGYGIELDAEPEALHLIAEEAVNEHTGARGLLTVLERTFRDYKFELPGTGIKRLTLTAEMVASPAASLEKLLQQNAELTTKLECSQVFQFAEDYQKETGFLLKFSPGAAAKLVELAADAGKSIPAFCAGYFKDFHYGLDLIKRNNGQTEFKLNATQVLHPQQTITNWMKAIKE